MYGLPGLFVTTSACIVLWRFVRRLDGRSLSPAGIYVVRWWLLIALYCVNPFGYPRLSLQAWFGVASALLCFLIGYLVVRAPARRRPAAAWAMAGQRLEVPVPRRLWRAVLAVFGVGLMLYLVYAVQVALEYGPIAAVLGPSQLRAAITNGQVPFGFHYLYFFEMVPALTVLLARHYRLSRPQVRLLIVIGTFTAVTLLGTTARTNAFKAVVWAGVVYLYTSRPRLFNRRLAVLVGGGVLLLMFLFTAIGNNLGKSYANSAFGTRGIVLPSWFRPLALPYHYNAAELPTLDALLHDGSVTPAYGTNTFNPLASALAAVIPGFSAPSHIGQFYSNPYPFNVATQLDVFFRDFGLVGLPLGSFVLGLLAGVITGRFFAKPWLPSRIMLVSWLAMILNSSTGAAAFAKISYVLQLVIILAIGRYVKERLLPGPEPAPEPALDRSAR
jgi:oligosaccharide repeat unit polymerase